MKYGCPYDCGLCPDHEQHSCLSLVEITDVCNLDCPIAMRRVDAPYDTQGRSSRWSGCWTPLCGTRWSRILCRISGGEPTVHPEFFAILDAAKRRPIKHLMVNTNGIRIATEDGFAERLATYMPKFELYSTVRLTGPRCADAAAWGGSAAGARAGAGTAECGGDLDDAGGDGRSAA